MYKEKRSFCCHQNFVSNGLSAPARGYTHMVTHEKNIYNIGLQSNFLKPATNGQSDKGCLLTPNVCPQGVVCPCPPGLYTYGPRQANLVLIAYASSEGSGEPAHPHSLARTFAARSYKQ